MKLQSAIAAMVFSCWGCAPVGGLGRARTLPRGRLEVTAGPEVSVVTGRLASGDVPLPSAQLVAGLHYGVSDRTQMGGRLWGLSLGKYVIESWGASVDGKFQLKRASDLPHTRETDIALAPRLMFHSIALGGTPQNALGLSLPLMFGWRAGQRHQWVTSLRYDYQWLTGESQTPLHVHLGGAGAAFVWQVNDRWAIVPELTLLLAPVSFNGESGSEKGKGLSILSLAIGFLYGR